MRLVHRDQRKPRRTGERDKLLHFQTFRRDIHNTVRAQRRVEVSELDPEARAKIFEEVEMSISVAEAYREAARCMRCYRVSLVTTEK